MGANCLPFGRTFKDANFPRGIQCVTSVAQQVHTRVYKHTLAMNPFYVICDQVKKKNTVVFKGRVY